MIVYQMFEAIYRNHLSEFFYPGRYERDRQPKALPRPQKEEIDLTFEWRYSDDRNELWDQLLGRYDPKSRTVFIADPNIQEYSKELKDKLCKLSNRTQFEVEHLLRELARLHGHAHALVHVGKRPDHIPNFMDIPDELPLWDAAYRRLPEDVREALAHFIVHAVVERMAENYDEGTSRTGCAMYEILQIADADADQIYEDWKKIEEQLVEHCMAYKKEFINGDIRLLEQDSDKCYHKLDYVFALIDFARKRVFRDLGDFLRGIEQEWETLTISASYANKANDPYFSTGPIISYSDPER